MNANRILLVSCYFPPGGGIHVQRALNLARYLPEQGFEVDVLTVRNPSLPTLDPGLVARIPASVPVHRTWTLEPPFHLRKKIWGRVAGPNPEGKTRKGSTGAPLKRAVSHVVERLLSPDPQILWIPTAIRKAQALVRKKQIGVVLVTAPPFSSFLIGNRLKRMFPDIQLVADFRDEWLDFFAKQFAFGKSPYVEAHAAALERTTVELASLVVSAAPAARDSIRRRYPSQPDDKFCVVQNGYDADEFNSEPAGRLAADQEVRRTARNRGEQISVAYVGTIYTAMSPAPFLDALDRLPDHVRARFATRLVGRLAEEFPREVLEGRKSSVSLTAFLPHSEAIRCMEAADILLLPCHDAHTIPGKMYEYLATGKPILAIAQSGGDIDQMIRRTAAGWCVDPKDGAGLDALLTRMATDPGALETSPNRAEIEKFTRRNLAGVYANLIRQLTPSDRGDVIVHA